MVCRLHVCSVSICSCCSRVSVHISVISGSVNSSTTRTYRIQIENDNQHLAKAMKHERSLTRARTHHDTISVIVKVCFRAAAAAAVAANLISIKSEHTNHVSIHQKLFVRLSIFPYWHAAYVFSYNSCVFYFIYFLHRKCLHASFLHGNGRWSLNLPTKFFFSFTFIKKNIVQSIGCVFLSLSLFRLIPLGFFLLLVIRKTIALCNAAMIVKID